MCTDDVRSSFHLEGLLLNHEGPFCWPIEQGLEQGNAGGIFGLLIKLHVEDKLCESAESLRVI